MFKKCSHCGNDNFQSAKYCIKCNVSFESGIQVTQATTVSQKPAQVKAPYISGPLNTQPGSVTSAPVSVPRVKKNPWDYLPPEDLHIQGEDEIVEDVDAQVAIANALLDRMEQKGLLEQKSPGVKFGQVAGTEKKRGKMKKLKEKSPYGKTSGKDILVNEGSNDSSLVARLKKARR